MRRLFFSTISLFLTFTPSVLAQSGAGLVSPGLQGKTAEQEEKFRNAVGFMNTGTGSAGLYSIVGTLINAVLSLLGVAFLVLVVYGGIVLFQARGEEGEVKKAQKIIEQGIIGLVVVLGAYAIAKFVLQKFTGVTLQTP